ncbi:MAG: ATP-binding protein [Planctomycetales bacterium]
MQDDPHQPAVLVVDDDPGTRRSLRRILALDGYRVDEAASVADVRAITNWNDYVAILLDRRLADGSAEELLPELKRWAPHAAVLIVTGFGDLESSIAALRAGAADYLLKPVEPETLRARVRHFADLRRAQDDLASAQRKLVQSERLAAIGQMMTGLAHESRNALQRAQACTELLEMDLDGRPEMLDLTARIRKSLFELHRLYEEVRGYAAPLHLDRQPCDLRETWREVWGDLMELHAGKSVRVREEAADDVDLRLRLDRHRIEQVLRNVFDNALAVSPEGSAVSVQCAEAAVEGRPAVRISIADDGPGLTPEQQQGIFEPFFTTKTRGTGLGMAIAKRIVEAHGGTIAAGNSPHGGAEITITLPKMP